MSHRISIAVDNPLRVAIALAEIWGGGSVPLAFLPNSYAVLSSVDYGTAIEIYPTNTECCVIESAAAQKFFDALFSDQSSTTYSAISVAASREKIEQIAVRERWQTRFFCFGSFEVVELRVENKFVLNLLPCSRKSAPFVAKKAMPTSNLSLAGSLG
jgi:hypothetical protein